MAGVEGAVRRVAGDSGDARAAFDPARAVAAVHPGDSRTVGSQPLADDRADRWAEIRTTRPGARLGSTGDLCAFGGGAAGRLRPALRGAPGSAPGVCRG